MNEEDDPIARIAAVGRDAQERVAFGMAVSSAERTGDTWLLRQTIRAGTRLGQNVAELVRQLPTNAQAYVKGIFRNPTPVDETFFKPDELAALRRATRRGMAQFASPERQGTREHISYQHYEQNSNPLNVDWKLWTDPDHIAMTTIGRALIERQPSGDVHVVDRYNFNSLGPVGDTEPSTWPTPWYGQLRWLGGRLLPEGTGYDIRLNLGNPDTWDEGGNIAPPVPRAPTQSAAVIATGMAAQSRAASLQATTANYGHRMTLPGGQ